jgi:DNA (cytosine-5)-methyltransferase 1
MNDMRLWVQRDSGLPIPGLRYFPGYGHGFVDRTDLPAATITTRPVAMVIESGGNPMSTATDKPPYSIPTMAEIAAVPWNGFTVASTFSGAGGSCLGYRMAGFKVAYANEFIPAALETYRANCSPSTIIDPRDIRQVQPDEVLAACKLSAGELDLLDGSPPCASFSVSGKRSAHWGEVRSYSDTRQRTDDLFFEFVRLLKGIQPRTFIAENVAGLARGIAKGYFIEILAALKGAGYRVAANVLDAQWLGVPQARQRLIFCGVRSDLNLEPVHPKPLSYRYSISEALPWLADDTIQPPQVEPETNMTGYAVGDEWQKLTPGGPKSDKYFQLVRPDPDAPCPSIVVKNGTNHTAGVAHPFECRKFSIAEVKRLSGFPADFILTGSYAQRWERIGRAVPPIMMAAIARAVAEGVLCKLK